jgi:hypothetical protein
LINLKKLNILGIILLILNFPYTNLENNKTNSIFNNKQLPFSENNLKYLPIENDY